ncbi:hypothetical protein ACOMHN_020585 [Nucella lapillus]
MAHKKALEAVNLSLKDIRDSPKIFGRVTLLLAGDFRQTLPIITGGTPADELSACLKSSHLWNGVSTLKLSTNMRARICQDSSSELFSQQLLQLGNGEIRSVDGLITFPEKFAVIVPEVQALKDSVYPDLHEKYHDHDWLSERAILAPRNDTVGIINNDLLMQLPADAKTTLRMIALLRRTSQSIILWSFTTLWSPQACLPTSSNLKRDVLLCCSAIWIPQSCAMALDWSSHNCTNTW